MQPLDLHTVTGWRDALVGSFENAFNQIIALAPKVVGMVLVLVIGYLVARLLDKFVTALAHSLGLETAAERSGLSASMRQAGIQRGVPWILGRIVFWLTMCVFLSAAFNILGLETVFHRHGKRSLLIFRACWWPPWLSSSVCCWPRSCAA